MKIKLFLLVTITFFISCGEKPDEETTRPVPVTTHTAILSDISLPIQSELTIRLRDKEMVRVSSDRIRTWAHQLDRESQRKQR